MCMIYLFYAIVCLSMLSCFCNSIICSFMLSFVCIVSAWLLEMLSTVNWCPLPLSYGFVGIILLFEANAWGWLFPCRSSSRKPCCNKWWISCIFWLWNDGGYSKALPDWAYSNGEKCLDITHFYGCNLNWLVIISTTFYGNALIPKICLKSSNYIKDV